MDELHKRVTDAIRPLLADEVYQSARIADAVIAALGLTEQREQGCTVAFNDDEPALHWAPRRRYLTPWERIEEDG